VLATADVRELLLHGKHAEKGKQSQPEGKTKLRTMLVELLYFFAKTYS
jgi:uridine nucleosidase